MESLTRTEEQLSRLFLRDGITALPQAKSALDKADIIIIGAGPAGCAAAIRARQASLRVVMLDANSQPKHAPGETLHPGIEPILKQLGVLDQVLRAGFQRNRGVWLVCGGRRAFSPYGEDADGPWLGIQADRRVFHQILQQAAIDAHATLLRNTRPEAVLMEVNRVMGVIVNGNHFRATWIVDATGRSAWLARQLELPVSTYSPPLGVRFGWRNEQPAELDSQPSFVFRDDGWDWQAPLADNRTAWVQLRIGDSNDAPPEGVNLTWLFRPECVGPGFFLVGDAAAVLDPASSHGVLRAVMSGMMAAHLIAAVAADPRCEGEAIETYHTWMSNWFHRDVRKLGEVYSGMGLFRFVS